LPTNNPCRQIEHRQRFNIEAPKSGSRLSADPDLVESGSALDSFVDRMSFSENRFPPRITSGAGFFRDMLWRRLCFFAAQAACRSRATVAKVNKG
jgi:hypothetical protein